MSYIINNSRGQIVAVVGDGTVNTTATNIALIGRAVTNYGEYQNENYVYLLENFANSTAPTLPVLGQLWYNSSTDEISVYNSLNNWSTLASQDYVQAQKISTALTGVPTAPTAAAGTSTTQLATTAFVTSSPQFSGVPTAPTATSTINTTQLATTAFVQNRLSSASGINSAGIISAIGISTNGSVSATGNVTGGNLLTTGLISVTGNVTGGNLSTTGQIVTNTITAVGNITGGNILGGANVNATTHTGTTVSVSGNVTGGNLLTSGLISATGNITGDNLIAVGNIIATNIIANNISTSGTNAFRLPNLTSIEISSLSALNGDMVYNTTTNLPQIYQNGVWQNFTISYYS